MNRQSLRFADLAGSSSLSSLALVGLLFWLSTVQASWAQTDFRNRIDLETVYAVDPAESIKTELVWIPTLESKFSKSCDLLAQLRLRTDGNDVLEPGVPDYQNYSDINRRDFWGTQSDGELRELWVRCSSERFHLTLGKQQVVWGKADGLKILDVVNPQSFREFILKEFEDSRIPLWTVNFEMTLGNTNLQLLYIPDPTYHEFPEQGAAYAFTTPLLFPPETDLPSEILPYDRPDDVFEGADWGARLSTFVGGWELSLAYLYQFDDTPVFRQFLVETDQGARAQVEPTYQRNHLVGGSFTNAFGELTVRGELGYLIDRSFTANDPPAGATGPVGENGLVESDELSYVLGLDWYGIHNSLLSFQVFESRLQERELPVLRPDTDTNVTALYRWWTGRQKLQLQLFWIHGIEFEDGLVRPELRWSWSDHGQLWLGYDAFYGGDDPVEGETIGYFGQFDRLSGARFGLRFEF